jgi:nucleotide-binding universal stress UspA family protein
MYETALISIAIVTAGIFGLRTRVSSSIFVVGGLLANVLGLFAAEEEFDSSEIDEQERGFNSLHRILVEKYFNHTAILIESKILHGDPAEKICEYAETMDADLVLVGTHGKGTLATVVLGSVSQKVANNCKRSVVVIKKPS